MQLPCRLQCTLSVPEGCREDTDGVEHWGRDKAHHNTQSWWNSATMIPHRVSTFLWVLHTPQGQMNNEDTVLTATTSQGWRKVIIFTNNNSVLSTIPTSSQLSIWENGQMYVTTNMLCCSWGGLAGTPVTTVWGCCWRQRERDASASQTTLKVCAH